MLVDSHCHLTIRFERHESPQILANAFSAGVKGIILAGYCPMHNRKTRDLLNWLGTSGSEAPLMAGTAGIHPHEADKFGAADVEALREHLSRPDIVAVGETGLDFFRNYADRKNQERLFSEQVLLASRIGMPLVIHSRDAFQRTVEILDEFELPSPPGVFHCFGYGPEEALRVLEMGFYVSFAGMITWPQSEATREACRVSPLNRILIETDSPFQTPQKQRDKGIKRNEPAYVAEVASAVAEIKGTDTLSVGKITAANVLECFPKLKNVPSWADLPGRRTEEAAL